jgi:acetyl-CoA carboxylase biotin carboxyl carrier protein
VAATFQLHDVEEMLQLMEQWGIAELHLTVGDATLDLQRAVAAGVTPVACGALVPASAATPEQEDEAPAPVPIPAPVVGIFHLAARGFPQGTPQPGDQVQAGQVIGNIELMHVPTDMVSPVSGTIEAIMVDDGAGVEYGQVLMVIRPFEEVSEDEAGMVPPPR